MAYAVIADLDLYGLPSPTLAKMTNAQKSAALEAASAEIDRYIRQRYKLPFISFGVEFTQWCVRIAKYRLIELRGFNQTATGDADLKADYDRVLLDLIDVREQKLHPECVWDTTKPFAQPVVITSQPRATPSRRV